MTLTDGTIINENLKFLGNIRLITNRAGDLVEGAYFSFNSRKIYFDTEERARTIRAEIIEKIPQAEIAKTELDSKWELPTVEETERE